MAIFAIYSKDRTLNSGTRRLRSWLPSQFSLKDKTLNSGIDNNTISSGIGKFRSWLRSTLNDGLIEKYLTLIQDTDQTLLRYMITWPLAI